MLSGSLEPGERFQMSRRWKVLSDSPVVEARVAMTGMAGVVMAGTGKSGLLGRGSVMSLRKVRPQPESLLQLRFQA